MQTTELLKKLLLLSSVCAYLQTSLGQELPPGVPRCIYEDGTIHVKPMFTTQAYQREALRLVIQEANQVAKELKLPEKQPITEQDLTKQFIGPFEDAYVEKRIGNITTSNYTYGVEHGFKFSDLVIANYDQACSKLKDRTRQPISQLDTNGAYQLATQWLSTLNMDVKTLNRECMVKVAVDEFWNGLKPGEKPRKRMFVPIYNVSWLSPKNQAEHFGDVVHVQLYAPTKTPLQITVYDPKYILRKPLVFTNLASLFPGNFPVLTNHFPEPIDVKFGPR